MRLDRQLGREWQSALAGNRAARDQWVSPEQGVWGWKSDGVCAKTRDHRGHSTLVWRRLDGSAIRGLRNFVVEVTLSGMAEAAGFSLAPGIDFLAAQDSRIGSRHLMLEVDVDKGQCVFRVDGRLVEHGGGENCFAPLRSAVDLTGCALSLKARGAEAVFFHDLAIHTYRASCDLSVIVTCYRFLQRLRVSLRNWCHQDLPAGSFELLVVTPGNPDGTHEHLAAVSGGYPQVRVRELAVGPGLTLNKGAMINRAIEASRGQWVWLTDADCLFSPASAAAALAYVERHGDGLFYGERRYLTPAQTNGLLAGRLDGLKDFDELSGSEHLQEPDFEPWGYTQIVHRSTLDRVRYREEINHFAGSDILFYEDCERAGIPLKPIEGLFCLHMHHPFSHYGTNAFL